MANSLALTITQPSFVYTRTERKMTIDRTGNVLTLVQYVDTFELSLPSFVSGIRDKIDKVKWIAGIAKITAKQFIRGIL